MMSRLKSLRELNKLKQDEVAVLLGMSPANYCKKESGELRVSLEEAKVLSDYYKLPIEVIFFESEVSIIETQDNQDAKQEQQLN